MCFDFIFLLNYFKIFIKFFIFFSFFFHVLTCHFLLFTFFHLIFLFSRKTPKQTVNLRLITLRLIKVSAMNQYRNIRLYS